MWKISHARTALLVVLASNCRVPGEPLCVRASALAFALLWFFLVPNGVAEPSGHDRAPHPLPVTQGFQLRGQLPTVAFSPDGTRLGALGHHAVVSFWDVASGRKGTVLKDQDVAMTAFTFDPSGKTVAGLGDDDRILLWDPRTGIDRHTLLPGPLGTNVRTIGFSPDGSVLASLGDDGFVVVWDVATGVASHVLSGHGGAIDSLAFSPDGKVLASGGPGSTVTLSDVSSGEERMILTGPFETSIERVAFSPDAAFVVGVGANGRVILWRSASGEVEHILAGHGGAVTEIAFSPDGRDLVSVGTDAKIQFWDPATGRRRLTLGNQPGVAVNDVAFSPDGKTLASATDDTTIGFWDVSTGKLHRILHGHGNSVASLAFSSDGRTLASIGKDGEVMVWDVLRGTLRFADHNGPAGSDVLAQAVVGADHTAVPGQSSANGLTPGIHSGAPNELRQGQDVSLVSATPAIRRNKARRHDWKGITALAISPDGSLVSTAGADSAVRLWEEGSDSERFALAAHHGAGVTGVAFAMNGSRLVSVGRDTEVSLWETASGAASGVLRGHEHPIRTIAASPDGKILATAGEGTRILLWDPVNGKLNRILAGHTNFINCLAFSGDGRLLASGDADDHILVWEVTTGRLVRTLLGHSGEVNSVAFSRNGNILVSAGEDTQVKVWNAATGEQIWNLLGHQAPVRAVAISPNGQTAVSAGEDTLILVWNVETGRLLRALPKHTRSINALVFHPSGRLFVGDEAEELTEWDNVQHDEVRRRVRRPTKPPRNSLSSRVVPPTTSQTLGARPPLDSDPSKNISAHPGTAVSLPGISLQGILGAVLEWLVPPAAAQLPDPGQGPGGPVLVITAGASTFGKYYAEILRTEGLNLFAVSDIGSVNAATLAGYDAVILAPMSLSAPQVAMFSDWVNAGGNLIAMRPDPQLSGLLGISAAGSTLSNAYLLVDTSQSPGNGLVGQTMQFHGTADRYTLNGASSLATLYADATTATADPAVTLRSIGTNGGQAAAFAYDLATSIVYTRQGNPAWAAQERDGFTPIRSDDKFFGNATGDPQPDWVDLNKVAIPQADEQQRLLSNLILEMNRDKKPLPRFWYFPRGKKAVVIMTGDDHGNGGTAGRFDQFKAQSPAGCSVANWECVRGTSYIYPNTPLSNAQAAAYHAEGFEVGLHINTNCADFTPASLETFYTQQIADWTAKYASIPPPATQRHHCIAWSDWLTGAKVQFNHAIRLDTSYYFWPPGWVLNRPGFFTGSGMPMRFADLNGTLVDVYHAPTQMTDESGQQYPFTVNTLLDRALGPEGYYGAFTINAHTDVAQIPESDATLSSALSRGVPIVSSRQMMTWLDGRNSSIFGSVGWSGNALNFTVTPGAGANGLQGLVPTASGAGLLTSLTRGGSSVSFTTETIKGVGYAFFAATAGAYVATYAADTSPPTVVSTSPSNGATGVGRGTVVTATFSEAMNAATITAATFDLRDPANTLVSASVAYNAATRTATLTPVATLGVSTTYTATIKGGATGVKDVAGNALVSNFVWSFTTAAGPSCPCSGWSDTTTPTNPSASDPNAVELGVKFRSDLDGFITGIRFYKGSGNTGTHVGNLWTLGGQQLRTATFTNETASGWQQVSFASPVAITANTVYVASYFAPNGHYAFDSSFFASTGFQNGPLYFLRDGENGGNGTYAYSASSSFPTNTFQATNYWVDVVFTTSVGGDTTPPTVTSTTPASGATGVSPGTTVTAVFNEAMDATTVNTSTFELRDAANGSVTATVTYNASTRTATLIPSSVLANGATYTATVKGGATDPRVKDVAGNALAANQTWSFTIAPADTTPPTVTSTTPASGATGVGVGTTVTATFSEAMDPATVNPSTFELRDGSNALVTATVTYNANTATLTPSSALANGATYTATVKGGATDPRAKDLAGNALAASLSWSFTTVSSSACTGNTIWPATTVPAVAADPDTSAVELGVKFRSDVNGTVCGVRFYKGSTNTGTHVGKLWSSGGTLLAQATFTGETASGWQQVSFSSPVAITANTVYVASYHVPNGRYSVDQGYFASGVDNPPLHALQDGVSGGNGVYLYGAGGFPINTFGSSNYWVDVVFIPGTAPTLASIAVTPANPAIQTSATQQFTATGTYSDSSTQNITTQVTWASSNTAVATINNAGLATAGTGAGTTTISATSGTVSGNTTLTVQTAPPITNTGFLAPSANAAVTSGAGDNNGFQTTPANAYVTDGLFAVDTNSGTNTNTSCTNAGKDKHSYFNYNFIVPSGVSIRGIEVRLAARVDSTLLSSSTMCAQLSWNGGTSWTTALSTPTLGTATTTHILGGATNTWGRTWTVGDFSNANFRVRIIDVASSTARDFSLDAVAVQVTYQ